MNVEYEPGSDAAYVQFLDAPVAYTQMIDDGRILDYAASGAVLGLELLGIKGGVRLSGLPIDRAAVAAALGSVGVPVLDEAQFSPEIHAPDMIAGGLAGLVDCPVLQNIVLDVPPHIADATWPRVGDAVASGGVSLSAA